jgi:nucleotide-binding universal stress UspA family protein
MSEFAVASTAAAQIPSRRSPPAKDQGTESAEAATPRLAERMLLATDLSPASEAATDRAISLAVEYGATLIVVCVVDPRRLLLPGGRFLRRLDQERAEMLSGAQGIVARARAAGARATFLVWEGDPAETIIAAAESEAVDIIVIGSHGRGRLGRLILGSTSARVADEAACPVVVVPS